MIRIAVVDDDPGDRGRLERFISQYSQETGEHFHVTSFSDGLDILEDYTGSYDIIFLDVAMKHLNGMAAAKRIRERDRSAIIIFITNLAQFAIQGYKVEALSYVLKPIRYFDFSQELGKAVRKVQENASFFLRVPQKDGMIRLDVSKISYVESVGHNVVYHIQGKEVVTRETLASVEQKLEGYHFARCNNGYLVNLAFVERMGSDHVVVSGETLQISRRRQKNFMEALANYMGGDEI